MFNLKTIICLVSTLPLLYLPSVYADSSSYFDIDASTVFPIENNSIKLIKEIIRIDPIPDSEARWKAVCEFYFYNLTNSPQLVTMGYPDWLNTRYQPSKEFWEYFNSLPEEIKNKYKYEDYYFVTGYGYDSVYIMGYREGKLKYEPDAWNLADLEVTVNGLKVKTIHKAISDKKGLPGDGAYIWKVKFLPHETKKVVVKFTFTGLTDVGMFVRAKYILKTGALWAENIGVADIYWNIKGRSINKKMIVPSNFSIKDEIIHWHFENFEPEYDIVITTNTPAYFPSDAPSDLINIFCSSKREYDGDKRLYTEKDLRNEKIEKIIFPDIKNHMRKFYLRALRNEIFARHGYRFNYIELMDIFGNCKWYKPDRKFSMNHLNEIERRNVQFILKKKP